MAQYVQDLRYYLVPFQRGPLSLHKDCDLSCEEPQEEECSTETVGTIAGGYAKGITRIAWNAQMRGMQQVLTVQQGNCITIPATFDVRKGQHFSSSHNDPLVVELKVANALLQYKVDDGNVGKLQGYQWTAQECYLVSIRPLVEHLGGRGLGGQQPLDKNPQVAPLPHVETLMICSLLRPILGVYGRSQLMA
ncbi:hypothetical protein Cgig2_027775 [Carnegiea gigantea]|uniref:Uncharacterized protein n=1 Tax=Carnegiea gigantea TaxID=171969 RepID=A0A9Q1JH15_9CARY|nr:hypothetical protein Cgig2_027775 [Carnegiea gigantea]